MRAAPAAAGQGRQVPAPGKRTLMTPGNTPPAWPGKRSRTQALRRPGPRPRDDTPVG